METNNKDFSYIYKDVNIDMIYPETYPLYFNDNFVCDVNNEEFLSFRRNIVMKTLDYKKTSGVDLMTAPRRTGYELRNDSDVWYIMTDGNVSKLNQCAAPIFNRTLSLAIELRDLTISSLNIKI